MGIFRSTKTLERQIDEFIDTVGEGAGVFCEGVCVYLDGDPGGFSEKLGQMGVLEARGDKLRRDIELQLYREMLIPESRGDVLGLLETMDKLLNRSKESLWQFRIEQPDIPEPLRADYAGLAESSAEAIRSLDEAARAFFHQPQAVSGLIAEVMGHEKMCDRLTTRLKEMIFATELELAHKRQLSLFVDHIDDLADRAENVGDRLVIYAVKRSL